MWWCKVNFSKQNCVIKINKVTKICGFKKCIKLNDVLYKPIKQTIL